MKVMVLFAALAATPVWAADAPSVVVSGPGGQARTLTAAGLEKVPLREESVSDPHSKEAARYRGVGLSALLSLVNAPLGDSMRGRALDSYVEVEAADGYRVVFSLAELDAGVGNTDALLAFEVNGQPLATGVGPFRLVVPTDKRGARWVRQVLKISLIEASRP